MKFLRQIVRRVLLATINGIGKTSAGTRIYQFIANSVMSNIATVSHDATQLRFVVPNHVNSWRVHSFSDKEPETLQWIDGMPPGAVLWDIGANVGLYSCYAAKRRGATVYAFEPSVFNLELLARNVWLNGLCERVTIVPLPLADRLMTSTLNMTTTEWGGAMSTFAETWKYDGSVLDKVFEFRTLGLSMDQARDTLGVAQPAYIKMDVDGLEHLILKGGLSVLRGARGVLVEINDAFERQAVEAAVHLLAAGLVLKEKRHAAIFDRGALSSCFNQIWHRPGTSET
jgi:FkbM family methyltransferase